MIVLLAPRWKDWKTQWRLRVWLASNRLKMNRSALLNRRSQPKWPWSKNLSCKTTWVLAKRAILLYRSNRVSHLTSWIRSSQWLSLTKILIPKGKTVTFSMEKNLWQTYPRSKNINQPLMQKMKYWSRVPSENQQSSPVTVERPKSKSKSKSKSTRCLKSPTWLSRKISIGPTLTWIVHRQEVDRETCTIHAARRSNQPQKVVAVTLQSQFKTKSRS